MSAAGRNGKALLLVGLLLMAAGLIFILFPVWPRVTQWLMRVWPVFLICAGVVRVMGYAIERKPRSPVGGMLLMFIGILFLASRFHSNLNALQIFGRYWLLLLIVYAGVELVRFYSHRHTEGPPPRAFNLWRLVIIALITTTGVFANRVAVTNPSVLSALKLPGFLSGIRDSVVGETYSFTDPPYVNKEVRPGVKISINNSYGNVKVTGGGSALKATLTKNVRAWSQDDARATAEQIRLVVEQTAGGLNISTNRDQIKQQFTTNLVIEVPSYIALSISDSYGDIVASRIEGDLQIKGSYGRVVLSDISGSARLALAYSDVDATNISGDLAITGAKRAKLVTVNGSLVLNASNGSVELRDIYGPAEVDAPFCSIVAQGLGDGAELKTQHASVKVSRAGDITITAPHSDVRAENISGDLSVSSSHSDIVLRAVAGSAVVMAEQSSVNAEDLRGPLDVKTSHGDVSVKNFYDSAQISTNYRDVLLIPAGQPSGDIEVENSHGQIKLVMPESSQFELDATSQSGQVKPQGFTGLSQKGRESLFAALGSDGPTIKLRTSYKDIIIQASGNRQAQARGSAN